MSLSTPTLAPVKCAGLDSPPPTQDAAGDVNYAHYYQEHPWPFLAGAVTAGYLLGGILVSGHGPGHALPGPAQPQHESMGHKTLSVLGGITSGLGKTFAPELHTAKQLAIGVALALVRDFATQAVPAAAAQRTAQAINDFARSLGSEPQRDPKTMSAAQQQLE